MEDENQNSEFLQPFTLEQGSLKLEILVESAGRDRGQRYYFNHPWLKDLNGRALKVHSKSEDVIRQKGNAVLDELTKDAITLTRKEFLALEDHQKVLQRLERQLEGTDLTLEMMIGQVIPTLRLLIPVQVTLAQAIEAGRAFFVPPKPMTIDEVIDGLIPLLEKNVGKRHVNDLKKKCEPLRWQFKGRHIHTVLVPELERLLLLVARGEFLTGPEKQKLKSRNRWKEVPTENGHEKWYSDASLVDFYDMWRRIFIRAQAVDAWPLLRALPTERMEKPKADKPELDALGPKDWAILLPALDKHMLRLVALILSDIRTSEIDEIRPRDIVARNGIPISVNIRPQIAKGKKGQKQGRVATLVPYTSVLLALSMPEGDEMFPCPAKDLMEDIRKKARELGIDPDHNCIRRMHDTYYYGLINAKTAINKDASHSKEMVDNVYRGAAAFEDCYEVFTTLPKETPPPLRGLVFGWAGRYWRDVRGDEPPAFGLISADIDAESGCAPATEQDGAHQVGEQSDLPESAHAEESLAPLVSPPQGGDVTSQSSPSAKSPLESSASQLPVTDARNTSTAAGPEKAVGSAVVGGEHISTAPTPSIRELRRGGSKPRIAWPESRADFLVEVWERPATKIAQRLGCSHAMVLTKAAEWELPRPGHGFFQRKNSGKQAEMTVKAKQKLAELRAEEEAAKREGRTPYVKAAEVPPIGPIGDPLTTGILVSTRSPAASNGQKVLSETDASGTSACAGLSNQKASECASERQNMEAAAGTSAPNPGEEETKAASEQASPIKRSRMKGNWPSDSELLLLLWQHPAYELGPRFGVSDVAVAKRARVRDLPMPDPSYRTTMARGGQLPIPDQVLKRIEELRRAEGLSQPAPQAPIPLRLPNSVAAILVETTGAAPVAPKEAPPASTEPEPARTGTEIAGLVSTANAAEHQEIPPANVGEQPSVQS